MQQFQYLLSSSEIKEIISKHDIVSYYLFLTFDELTRNLVMRYYTNNLPSLAIFNAAFTSDNNKLSQCFKEARMLTKQKDQIREAMHNLVSLQILQKKQQSDAGLQGFRSYSFNRIFFEKAVQFHSKFNKKNKNIRVFNSYKASQFNLIELIQSKKTSQNCHRLPNCQQVSKDLLYFVRSSNKDKIYYLISAYFKQRFGSSQNSGKQGANFIVNLLTLTNLKPRQMVPLIDRIKDLILALQNLRLVKTIKEDKSYFIINDHLHQFLIRDSPSVNYGCEIIVQINFMVYLIASNSIPSFLREIFKQIVEVEQGEKQCGQFMVGRITKDRCLKLFDRGISADDLLKFLNNFVKRDCRNECGLGHWRKIKFLNDESTQLKIPPYVAKEVSLWERNLVLKGQTQEQTIERRTEVFNSQSGEQDDFYKRAYAEYLRQQLS